MSNIVNVILSGGVGSRLWPLSRKDKPKQYLDIFENNSLFSLTINRNIELVDKLLIVSNLNNFNLGKKVLEKVDKSTQYIIETLARNTTAAIALACLALEDDDIILVTPSDHLIGDDNIYNKAVEDAITLAKDDFIVTFGIQPYRAETGFGYIEFNNQDVISFREKPSKELAEEFCTSGRFMWNSGMFCFKAKILLEELEKYDKEIYDNVKIAWDNRTENFHIKEEHMALIPSKSIDYSVMEKSDKIKMIKSDFYWSDLGSFDALYDYLISQNYPVDYNGNMYIGNEKIYTEFVGIQNSILVYTADAILVLNKDNAQDVKNIYEKLEKSNSKYT